MSQRFGLAPEVFAGVLSPTLKFAVGTFMVMSQGVV
jgi:hypothetical protein